MRVETEIMLGNLTKNDLFRWEVNGELWTVLDAQDAFSEYSFWLDAQVWRPADWPTENSPAPARYQTGGNRLVWLVTP